ncbi:putative Amidoligase enzyme [Seiridium unicorne]|uniref:Amidoligase enzyme n=1 Tax=Seiridium unicorne TaxID=138068 RepID=A0ABR2UKS6_9PEZI
MASGSSSTPASAPAGLLPLTKGFEFELFIPWRWNADRNGVVKIPMPENISADVRDGCVVVAYQQRPKLGADNMMNRMKVRAYAQQQCDLLIYDLLTQNGIDVNDPRGISDPSHPSAPVPDDSHRNADKTNMPEYYRWLIKRDPTIYDPVTGDWNNDGEPYHVHDVELISPVMLARSQESNDEVVKVLRIMKENFACFTPQSCGLHIHIAQGLVPFDAVQLRKIAALLYMVEGMYTRLHPTWRHVDDFNHLSMRESNLALGMSSQTANNLGIDAANVFEEASFEDELSPIDCVTACSTLMRSNTPQAVQKLMKTDWRAAYDFTNVIVPRKPTIEFRQAAGTLNELWILHWSDILVQTVDLARSAPENLLLSVLAPLFATVENGSPDVYSCDRFLREQLRLGDTADYIQRTTPEQRSNPTASAKQQAFRGRPDLNRQLGPGILPPVD